MRSDDILFLYTKLSTLVFKIMLPITKTLLKLYCMHKRASITGINTTGIFVINFKKLPLLVYGFFSNTNDIYFPLLY